MVEGGPSSEVNDLPPVEPPASVDFSSVQGFQVVGVESGVAPAADDGWREALKLELEARAARLHQAVDAAIVLANDGIIRWLGDPVAKLSLGSNGLSPSVVILADESLPEASREIVKTRIELWVAATIRRVLAPLFALEAIQHGSEAVRDLAQDLVRSLGILEREPIKAKIKALAQDDRSELRKQGVRFGAYYIFVPALLKPAARNLALQLWGVQSPGDVRELLRTLGLVASSGRTSFTVDKEVPKDGYRVSGYRPCGDRIVRVDVLERLAGIIRGAIDGEPQGQNPAGPRQRSSRGFVVTGQMTSLTGCSGEAFASILRSIGFRPVEMKRSEFYIAQATAGAVPDGGSPKAEETAQSAGDEHPSPPAAYEGESAAEPILDAALLAEAAPQGAESLESAAEAAEAIEDVPEAALEHDDPVLEDADPVSEAANSFAESVAEEPASALGNPEDSMVASDSSEREQPAAEGEGQATSSQPPSAPRGGASDDDVIVVWRPDHRKPAPRRDREGQRSRSESQARSNAPRTPVPAANAWRRDGGPRPHKRQDASNLPNGDEKRRQRTRDHDMARPTQTTAPQQKAKVDPNSPFAKLLELRSLLEERGNKRQ